MPLTDALAQSPALLLGTCAVLGLIVGSFLNVVILRLPVMMERHWRQEARETVAAAAGNAAPPAVEGEAPLSLWSPPSCCPHCHARIRPWQNVPVISWLLLRGRCAQCQAHISIQYPLVELACGVLSAVCAWRFGWSLQLAGALVFTWSLLALAVIDLRTLLLPDSITLPLLWLGLLLSLGNVYCDPAAAIPGAVAGYLILWTIYHVYRLLTHKEGMGYGDFKLLAAIGAWLGIGALPAVILLSSVVGAVTGITLVALRRHSAAMPLSFGPYLAGAGWIALIFGAPLTQLILG
ncbi:MAG: prepilin peptidase [Nevskiaceae bacterium]|nr:MAG: prepilin peptidase [Nevskiaceae bacterium]TBR73400.1 MAG: prepilin peptidase [Nevskiaceae bacterium]